MINTKFRKCCVESMFTYIVLPFISIFFNIAFSKKKKKSIFSFYVLFLSWKHTKNIKTLIFLANKANMENVTILRGGDYIGIHTMNSNLTKTYDFCKK